MFAEPSHRFVQSHHRKRFLAGTAFGTGRSAIQHLSTRASSCSPFTRTGEEWVGGWYIPFPPSTTIYSCRIGLNTLLYTQRTAIKHFSRHQPSVVSSSSSCRIRGDIRRQLIGKRIRQLMHRSRSDAWRGSLWSLMEANDEQRVSVRMLSLTHTAVIAILTNAFRTWVRPWSQSWQRFDELGSRWGCRRRRSSIGWCVFRLGIRSLRSLDAVQCGSQLVVGPSSQKIAYIDHDGAGIGSC